MKRLLLIAIGLGIAGFLLADDVYAHGGSFRGPNGGVPPGLREPSDPEPPPPPPSDPGNPGGPTTPSDPAPGPTTPDEKGHETPKDTGPPQPVGPTAAKKKKTTTKSLTFESWRFWWGYNNDDILNLKSHIYSERTSSSSPLFFTSRKDEENRRSAQRPTERKVLTTIIPALRASLNRKGDHEDIHGGALVALGKIGTETFIPLFEKALNNEFQTDRGEKIDFGYQATESAALALGLLPNLDARGKEAVRRVCLEAIADEEMRTRERTWCAVSLGLLRDVDAIPELMKLLEKKYPDDNIPAGILCGIGLMGDDEKAVAVLPELVTCFKEGTIGGQEVGERISAFACYAIQKIGNPAALEEVLKVLKSRRYGRIVKRSATIAAGVLAGKADEAMQDEAVKVLTRYINKSGGDPSGENFAIIALGQIGNKKANVELLKLAENGKYGQRPFAGLALATQIFYKDRAAEAKKGEPMDPKERAKIVETLIKLSDKYKDSDTKAAFMLCRGLVKDPTAIEECVQVVAKRSAAPVLRGFCCVALGLIGDASEHVKDAMKLALRERKSTDLRRDAATGLGLLRDAEVVKLMLDELRKAKSFAVQGQLITAIGTIGDHTAIQPLVDILDSKSQPAQTRAMAAVGLGMIGDLREIPSLARLSKNYNYRASVNDLDELLFIL